MTARISKAGLAVAPELVDFIETRALPGTGVPAERFWQGLADAVADCGETNRALLQKRETLQSQIDAWYLAEASGGFDAEAQENFLREIGYITPEGEDFTIETTGTDPEIASIAGPQLVVPVMNARYALNAANARWGSLYDALYGSDALGEPPQSGPYSPERGAKVITWGRDFLDGAVPLLGADWRDARGFEVEDGNLYAKLPAGSAELAQAEKFIGWTGEARNPSGLFFENNGLHIHILINPETPIGASDRARISDIRLEAAISAIMDCEDSIAAVDAEDKVLAYSNWLGLMQGNLSEQLEKNGKIIERRLAPDLEFTGTDGKPRRLKGRALMLVRNVGHLMTTPAVLDSAGDEIGEGILDAFVTTLCAMHDLQKSEGLQNSSQGAVYVVKPKMHGPEEVALTVALFDRVEACLGLPPNTVKLGIMDEERRTSVNLKEAIRAAKSRVAFINTGFLDRTGDEIHTAMEAGPMVRKSDMKLQSWIAAYENRNVDIGLSCGLQGRAQIGKGMWAAPDMMEAMLEQKVAHPKSGANCAWVPSPTAAVLHATHYHRIDVVARQNEILETLKKTGPRSSLAELLEIPLAKNPAWSAEEIQAEVDNNVQGILGYVVRWIDQGIGCSKVPDIHNIALMEDRATCRISSQALANWLHHGVISQDQILAALEKMARVVDAQNASDPSYRPMAPEFNGNAFLAAKDLALQGRSQPSGYTEPLLHHYRRAAKG